MKILLVAALVIIQRQALALSGLHADVACTIG